MKSYTEEVARLRARLKSDPLNIVEFGAEQAVGQPGFPRPEDFSWHYAKSFPVSRLRSYVLNGFRSKREAEGWIIDSTDEYNADYLTSLEDSVSRGSVTDPITVAVLKDGTLDLCDGWHRFAFAVRHGVKVLPAFVGTLPR